MKVSVVLPTYNRCDKLMETVQNIEANKTQEDFELIIVNDNSTDETEAVVSVLQLAYRNIVYVKNTRNLGPAGARNIGIKMSLGDYIFFTDDDCLVPKNWIKKYSDFLDKHPNVAGVGGILQPAVNNWVARTEILKDKILKIRATKTMIGRAEVPTGFTNNMAYRRNVFDKVGFFDESFKIPGGEDPELKGRVVKEFDIAFLPVKVLHNHTYNLDYLLGIMIKQGLNRKPPKSLWKKAFLLIGLSPLLVFNVVKKVWRYRNEHQIKR